MTIIFENGNKILNQESADCLLKQLKEQVSSARQDTYRIEKDYEIYGNDFKIEINGDYGECAFALKSYNEAQGLEHETVVSFNKNELNQLIAAFSSIRENL